MTIRNDNAQPIPVTRVDLFETSDFSGVEKTDEGFLRVPIRATRVGVFSYLMKDGSIRRELRHPDDVFNKDSLKTLAGKPITIRHPKDLVTSKNFDRHSVGLTGDKAVVGEETFVDTIGTITKDRAVKMVEKKRDRGESQEVSCGYRADIIEESGIFNGETYDVRQTNIRYNHVALVDRGRAGKNVKLRLDDNQAILYDKNIELEEPIMETIKIDGQEFEVSPETAKAFRKFVVKNDEALSESQGELKKANAKAERLDEENQELKKSRDKLEAKKDSLEDDLKEANKKLDDNKLDHNEIDKLVEDRARVCGVAEKVVGEDFKKDGKTNLEIMKEVIAKKSPDLKLDEKSDDYVEARFDSIAEGLGSSNGEDKLRDGINKGQKKGDEEEEVKTDSNSAREKFIKDSQDEWKKPLSTTREE